MAPNELRLDISAMDYTIEEEKDDEKGNKKRFKGYERDKLITELCNAYNNKQDDKIHSVLTNILIKTLGFKDEEKRQQFYDLLLHKYCRKYQLNNNNLVTLFVNKMKISNEWNDNDIKQIEEIARNYKTLNGRIFINKPQKQPEFKTSTQFAKIFQKMDSFKENKLRKKLVRLYVNVNKWEAQEYKAPEPERPKNDQFEIDDEYQIDLIRTHETDNEDLPKYIHKSIWYQSWDEKIESLIDNAVLKVLNLPTFWQDEKFINKIYNDYQFY
eukprot:526297_1